MPFDIADLPEASAPPSLAAVAAALDTAAGRRPGLLVGPPRLAELRAEAAAMASLQRRVARCLDEPAAAAPQTRDQIKREARRLIVLAFAALVGGGRESAAEAAARAALARLAAAPSWQHRPVISSFLDRSETAVSAALAYDWLYERLSTAERRAAEAALVRHILEPAAAAYADPDCAWLQRQENFTVVSHAGVAIAALAVVPQRRALVVPLLHRVIAAAWRTFAAFGPDGGWHEGPSYWSLCVRHAGLLVAALESVLGHSFGLAQQPGLAETGEFALHVTGPSRLAFDFGDSVAQFDRLPLAWLAHRYRRPVEGWLASAYDGWHLPLSAIWGQRPQCAPQHAGTPTGKVFHGCQLACFRNSWSDGGGSGPVYLAIKGGNGRPGTGPPPLHAQADAGTFVLDTGGRRWALDLGPDDYDLPGYFDHGTPTEPGARWAYYRAATAGHNTLVIGGSNQVPGAASRVLGSAVAGGCQWAVMDLSAAYAPTAHQVRRGAALIGRHVVIRDEVCLAEPLNDARIVWTMHTSADPARLSRRALRLRLRGEELVLRIVSPAGARLTVTLPPTPRQFPVAPEAASHAGCARRIVSERPYRDAENRPIRRIEIHWPPRARRLTVMLSPGGEAAIDGRRVAPLDDWLAGRPLRRAARPLSPRHPLRYPPGRGGAAGRAPRRAAIRAATAKIGRNAAGMGIVDAWP